MEGVLASMESLTVLRQVINLLWISLLVEVWFCCWWQLVVGLC